MSEGPHEDDLIIVGVRCTFWETFGQTVIGFLIG